MPPSGPPAPRNDQAVEAEGPKLVHGGYTRYAVLIRLADPGTGGAAGYAVATAVRRPRGRRRETYVFFDGFGPDQRSLAWRAFADRINQLAFELEGHESAPVPAQTPRLLAFPAS